MEMKFSEKVTIEHLQLLLLKIKEYGDKEDNTVDFVNRLKDNILSICTGK